jgi:uncharacterized membrane protein
MLGGVFAHTRLWRLPTRGEDVYYGWVEGQRLQKGENPYARVLTGNLRDNDKYATYFPVFYYGSYLTIVAGLDTYEEWIAFWRVIFLLANLGIAGVLFYLPFRRQLWPLALFGPAFWLFNRWTLHVTRIAQIDFLAILPLIISVALFPRRRYLSLLLLSLSIGVKQIGLFLVPLYLIWIWRETAPGKLKHALIAVALVASIPVLTSVPFLIWNPQALVISVVFDAIRNPADHFDVASFDAMIGWVGLLAKAPMVALMLLVFALTWQRHIGRWLTTLLVMAVFVDFSSVLFRQYFVWEAPFIPLAVLDLLQLRVPYLSRRAPEV